jgi:UDPglucose 6-dehydrogenase
MSNHNIKIGIIGQGFVGSAIREGLCNYYKVLTYDLDESKSNSEHSEVCENSDIIFVCLPTPMNSKGECDTRILEGAIKEIEKVCTASYSPKNPVLVIKSTVTPGTTKRINKDCKLEVCFSPEFLTEANSFEDFKNQNRIIIGGNGGNGPRIIKSMFRKPFPKIPIVVTKSNTAEMVKYFTNCFLATKVIFANEMYAICKSADIDYDKVCEYALHDQRIGKSHLAVPGPDGDLGYGGHCFPKDLSALSVFGQNNGHDAYLLEVVEEINNKIRTDRDWEKMKGRAISED